MKFIYSLFVFFIGLGSLFAQDCDLVVTFQNPHNTSTINNFIKNNCPSGCDITLRISDISGSIRHLKICDGTFIENGKIYLNVKDPTSPLSNDIHIFTIAQKDREILAFEIYFLDGTGKKRSHGVYETPSFKVFKYNKEQPEKQKYSKGNSPLQSIKNEMQSLHKNCTAFLASYQNRKMDYEEFNTEYLKHKNKFELIEQKFKSLGILEEEFEINGNNIYFKLKELINKKLLIEKNKLFNQDKTGRDVQTIPEYTPPEKPPTSSTANEPQKPKESAKDSKRSTPSTNWEKEIQDCKNALTEVRESEDKLLAEKEQLADKLSGAKNEIRNLETNNAALKEAQKNSISHRFLESVLRRGTNFVFDSLFMINGEYFEFVPVKKGEFKYGLSEEGYKKLIHKGGGIEFDDEIIKEEYRHQLIKINYLIGKYEITNAQYGAIFPRYKFNEEDAQKPVVNLTAKEMLRFCDKLNEYFGLHADKGVSFDLPTEQEWEYAAKGNEEQDYPWGNTFKTGMTPNANIRGGKILPGGKYENGKSWCNAYDMVGNVYEACKIDKKSYKNEVSREVICARGGSFKTDPLSSRVTSRYTLFGKKKRNDLGIRIVLRVTPTPTP